MPRARALRKENDAHTALVFLCSWFLLLSLCMPHNNTKNTDRFFICLLLLDVFLENKLMMNYFCIDFDTRVKVFMA